jgi:hypothetical protein
MPISRLAALALLALLIWSLVTLVEAPLVARVARDRAFIAAAALPGGFDAGQASKLRAQQVRLQNFVGAATWPLDRSSPELLAAQLQRMIESAATRTGAAVTSSRTVPTQLQQSLDRISLDIDVAAALPALQNLLHAIEAARPPIFVDRLTVQRPETGDTKPGGGEGDLAVTLHISIYAAPDRMAALP